MWWNTMQVQFGEELMEQVNLMYDINLSENSQFNNPKICLQNVYIYEIWASWQGK